MQFVVEKKHSRTITATRLGLGIVSSKINDKQDDFNIERVNLPSIS